MLLPVFSHLSILDEKATACGRGIVLCHNEVREGWGISDSTAYP